MSFFRSSVNLYFKMGDYDKAIAISYQALKVADPTDYNLKTLATTAISSAYIVRGDYDKAQYLIQEILNIIPSNRNFYYDIGTINQTLGFLYSYKGDYDKAIELFTRLLPLWKQLGDIRAEGLAHLIIGRVYDLQKNFRKSLEYNLNSLPYWRKTQDTDQESFTLMNIGNLYSYLEDHQKTIEYFEQALKTNEKSERKGCNLARLMPIAQCVLVWTKGQFSFTNNL